MRRGLFLAVAIASSAGFISPAAPAPTAMEELRRIVELSPAPEYRRFGSPGMAAVADHVAGSLAAAGLTVRRHDVPATRYAVDYGEGRAPLLVRVGDGRRFATESVFGLKNPTGPAGIECIVRPVDEVGSGDCGLVPFAEASPEWKNLRAHAGDVVAKIAARGGVGAVIQGDVRRGLVIALRIRTATIPAVVSVVDEADVIGQRVRLRAVGGEQSAMLHNVVGVRRPPSGSTRYIVIQGHADGWFQAAADNGSGTAAVLRAARMLATDPPPVGLLVVLYDGEEVGLLGSAAFSRELLSPTGFDVGDCGPRIRMADIATVINLDASSAKPSDATGLLAGIELPLFSWRAMVASASPAISSLFHLVMAEHGVLGLPLTAYVATSVNGGMDRTDGKWFHEVGIPVVWPVAGYPEYHTTGDDLDAVDAADLEHVAAATADLTRRAASLPIEAVAGAPKLPDPGPPALGDCPQTDPASRDLERPNVPNRDLLEMPATR